MKKNQELTLKIEDLEERIAPHLIITPAEPAYENGVQPEVHPQADVHGRLGPLADDIEGGWRISTPGHEVL
ncbi:hypothetical protein [Methylomarinum vadi]|uniref:hypothetical protein n=1 Tax=Methylomarinum vadi TaxID=438855 RepID=UPI0004DF599D|nr:hypothetical protein [Methylomarinum vadi]